MKKSFIALICIALVASAPASSQKLADLYKQGTIKLIPDKTYAQDNDWNTVFRSYRDSMGRSNIGARKSLMLMPDGSVIVNHTYRNFYTKFNPQGKFVKEFNLKTTKGKVFKKTEPILGVINGNTLFCDVDDPGNMYCVDFNGNWVKTLKFDYIPRQILAVSNKKFATMGWTITKDYTSDFFALVNYDTGEKKTIWEHREPRTDAASYPDYDKSKSSVERPLFEYGYFFKTGGGIGFGVSFDGVSTRYQAPILAVSGNKLLLAFPGNNDLWEYDLNGNLLEKKNLGWSGQSISVEEQKEELKKEMDNLQNRKLSKARRENTDEELEEAKQKFLREMQEDLERISNPIPKPFLSTIIKDSDGNVLFFEYPKEKNNNIFHVWVYANGGSFVCQSKFVCDEYDLVINPSRMVFRNGYLYSLQNAKGATGIPMRLVRFKLTAE
jgi:hypothetical protein